MVLILIGTTSAGLVHGHRDDTEWNLGDPAMRELISSGHFTENLGQWDESIYFVGNTDHGRIGFGSARIQSHHRAYTP